MRDRSSDRRLLGLFTGRPRAVVVAAGLGVALLGGPVASTTALSVAAPDPGSSSAQPTRAVAVPSTLATSRTVQYDVRDVRHPRSGPAATPTTTPSAVPARVAVPVPPAATTPAPTTTAAPTTTTAPRPAAATVTTSPAVATSTTAPTTTTIPTSTPAPTPVASTPATVRPFYVDPDNPAAKQVRAWLA